MDAIVRRCVSVRTIKAVGLSQASQQEGPWSKDDQEGEKRRQPPDNGTNHPSKNESICAVFLASESRILRMAPWFCFLSYKWERNLQHVPFAKKAGKDKDGIKKVVNDMEGAIRMVKKFDRCPMIVSLLLKERCVMILHNIWEHKGHAIGIAGFHMSSPLILVEMDQFVREIIPVGASGEKAAISLPTMRQLLRCGNTKEILATEGESKETVASLVGMP